MNTLRALSGVVAVLTVAACTPEASGEGEGEGGVPAPASYQVPDTDCPSGWFGLLVTTDSDAEVDYLSEIPACTNADGSGTYLENRSQAVWVLRSTSSSPWSATPSTDSPKEQSFVRIVGGTYPGVRLLVPGAGLTADLRPDQVEWVIDLPLTFAWQAHDLTVDKIQSNGQWVAIDALRGQTPAGAALAACTLAVKNYADLVNDLETADPEEVLVDGMSVGADGSRCLAEAAEVETVDEAGRRLTLADDIRRLGAQTEVLERAAVQLDIAQRVGEVLRVIVRSR